jgi:hypothetical protein
MSEILHDSDNPFVVRAHHAEFLWCIQVGGMSPEQVAEGARAISDLPHIPGYRQDVLGTTPAEADTVVGGVAAYLRSFNALPDDAQTIFTAQQKDGICASCIVGAHCEIQEPTMNKDARWIAGMLVVADQYDFAVTHGTYTNAGPNGETNEIPLWLRTDARTARSIVSDPMLPVRAILPGFLGSK